jgi:bifunctional UDP-N-acetylglucosamine pyrophosphorylase/glucosamine-1-phosphate N-acetyltransferase
MGLSVIVLAAGQGTRMRSALPKVLHPIAGRPMLAHVLSTAYGLGVERPLVVYGHGGDQVRERLADFEAQWVEQDRQLGTGHAVAAAMPRVPDGDTVLVLYGDVPLIAAATLQRLTAAAQSGLGLLTIELQDATGYGRILRDSDGRVLRIVEHKDAQPEELRVREINTGMLATDAAHLRSWLGRLDNANSQGEYYLTDVIAMAVAEDVSVHTVSVSDPSEVLGVNDRVQLAELERCYQRRQARRLMRAGVTLYDPERFDLRGELETGLDVEIDVNVVVEGKVRLGDGVRVGPNTLLRDVSIGPRTQIRANCVIEEAVIGSGAIIGPFARVRPETRLGDGVHIGNFVEIKKSSVDAGSKINHLSYVGDTTMGTGVNIGAGTITCNYDGANKHRTVIGDGAFIGSDTQLVAPVEVGAGATIGAGTTLTRNAPPGELTLSRAPQSTRPGWSRPTKKRT